MVKRSSLATPQRLAHRWELVADHGIVSAVQILELSGREAAFDWFTAHEQLPPHDAARCPALWWPDRH